MADEKIDNENEAPTADADKKLKKLTQEQLDKLSGGRMIANEVSANICNGTGF